MSISRNHKSKSSIRRSETTEASLPFVFEVVYENETDFHIDVINGEERIRVAKEDIYIGLDRKVGKDTFLIKFPIYESYIKGLFESRVMEGEWVATNRENYRIPFVAKFGKKHRFTQLKKTPKICLKNIIIIIIVNVCDIR